jgi:hypothetical protein
VTYSYSGDPADSDLDQVRFTLQDTDAGFPLLQDEEVQFLIDTWRPRYDSLTYVAAIAAATISRKFVGVVSVSADGVSVSTSDLVQRYRDLALDLRKEYKEAQLVGFEPIFNDDSMPKRFRMGLHDSPMAGLQDFGDFDLNPFMVYEYMLWTGVFP